jgi:hypothetical protein
MLTRSAHDNDPTATSSALSRVGNTAETRRDVGYLDSNNNSVHAARDAKAHTARSADNDDAHAPGDDPSGTGYDDDIDGTPPPPAATTAAFRPAAVDEFGCERVRVRVWACLTGHSCQHRRESATSSTRSVAREHAHVDACCRDDDGSDARAPAGSREVAAGAAAARSAIGGVCVVMP